MKVIQIIATVMLGSALMLTLPACEKDGPVEKAGEKVDEGVEEAGEAAEDAGNEVEEAAEDAGDEVEEATDGD